MYACKYVCICVWMYDVFMCACMHVFMQVDRCVCECMHVSGKYVCMNLCMYARMYVCAYVQLCVSVYAGLYACWP
jgi:hypothetical protein